MNFHNIEKCDMKNGSGIRAVIWVSGCDFHCKGCFNEQTHPFDSGLPFGEAEKQEILEALKPEYIQGLSILGGEPLHPRNLVAVTELVAKVKEDFPDKDIWIWTGYRFETVKDYPIMKMVDVLCDGRFIEELKSPNKHWVGSENQRVIDVQCSLRSGQIILHDDDWNGVVHNQTGKRGCGE